MRPCISRSLTVEPPAENKTDVGKMSPPTVSSVSHQKRVLVAVVVVVVVREHA